MTVYRSAQGRQIDMTQLAAKNEKVRAVGNMNVNARGDVIDNNNQIITDGTKRVKTTYNKTVVKNAPKPEQTPTATQKQAVQQPEPEPADELSLEEQELFDDTDEDIKK